MELKQFEAIQGWFEVLNKKIEGTATTDQLGNVAEQVVALDKKIDDVEKRLDLKIENRFQMLASSIRDLSEKIENYRDQQNEEISILRHAVRDLEREVKELYKAVHS